MIDNSAPIIPGKSAGGINIGDDMREILQHNDIHFEVENLKHPDENIIFLRCKSENIDIWTQDSIVWQIMVHGNYKGKVFDKVGIGSTFGEVEKYLGKVHSDMDNLVVENLPGIYLEPEGNTFTDLSPVVEIYIGEPDWSELPEWGIPRWQM